MNYPFLKLWTEQVANRHFTIKEIRKYQNQLAIFFKKKDEFLQINFYPSDSFCFYTKNKRLPFTDKINYLSDLLYDYKITSTEILPDDRIIKFSLKQTDMFNKEKTAFLYIELIPYFANIIITDQNNIIKEAYKKITPAQNHKRIILPGLKYETFRMEIFPVKYPIKIMDLQLDKTPEDMNAFFETLYYEHILHKIESDKKKEIEKRLKKEIKKKEKKIEKLQRELADFEKEKRWQKYLELLKSVYPKIHKGMSEIEVIDYYSAEMSKIKIPLNPLFNASQNINFYAKKYKKSVKGKEHIRLQIAKTKEEIKKLKSDLESQNFTQSQAEIKKEKKQTKSLPFKSIKINEDWEIIFGRTKTENDFITTKVAKPYDWWFHTRIFHGTHLVLRNFKKKEPSERLIKLCAAIAAYYSKAKKSQNVPVDYTQIKFVRKPRGSQPGFVTYTRQKTIYIDPIDERKAVEIIAKWKI